MKNKLAETKLRSGTGLTRNLISGVLCLAGISLICARASAQNLFVSDFDFQGNYGIIDEFTPNGVRSTFASGLNDPAGLAFDKSGNLFVAWEHSRMCSSSSGTANTITAAFNATRRLLEED